VDIFRRLIFSLAVSSCSLQAEPEPWADPALPFHDGLILWLDAKTLRTGSPEMAPLPDHAQVERWRDASGMRRDLLQPSAQGRPTLRLTSGGSAVVRFDGRDDFLSTAVPSSSIASGTVFLVAVPRANPGGFRAFVSANGTGANDFLSGLNFDLGGRATADIDVLNAEGAGFSGERDLLPGTLPPGGAHVMALQIGADRTNAVRLFVDGLLKDARERKTAAPIRLDQITVGARYCVGPGETAAPHVQGFFDGDVAELLVFSRALTDAEIATVSVYLAEKHRALLAQSGGGRGPGKPLVPVANPPLVQMLFPGFVVRELPVALTNIDCLRYREDGKLVVGAYNGKIWVLSDTDRDGLEDRADLFWESDDLKNVIGMALAPPTHPQGEGVFVATAGRILFIPDKNQDGRGDEQIVVATGWEKQESPGGGGSVDALGLTLGPDHSVYFALGTSAYNNAYLLDKAGVAHYRLESERGTILRIAPDFSKREIICTGIRYPVGAAFNRDGDLFVTEQEGATWLPNGNPFDELLQIQRGRHYGFPPRHPRHLPNVIDEPSTFDYGPQHQSTCGLVFNETKDGRAAFGPGFWRGDAIVAGESRGKLWRTKLVKTDAGYIAQTQLVACLGMLAVDVAVAPNGDLVLCCHSGKPDWGTGPQGAGKIFRIHYPGDRPAAVPVLAWSQAPDEFRIALDRPVNPAQLKEFAKRIEITRGRYVAAGDRWESFQPGYQAVKDQLAAPRFEVPALSTALSADQRTLVVKTASQNASTTYALRMPDIGPPEATAPGEIARVAETDIATNLCGIEARWQAADGSATQTFWLPHLDFDVARALTAGSAMHGPLWQQLGTPGTLHVRTKLDLWNMLRPALQPGATLDYQPAPEKVTVTVTTNPPRAGFPITLERAAAEGEWAELAFDLPTGGAMPNLRITWRTAEDARPRPFPLHRFMLPWAQPERASANAPDKAMLPQLAGGNWLRGEKLFYGKATCGACHLMRGRGGAIGPDLSNLVSRDYESVVRDIREPGAAINPDHLAYQVTLRDGTETVAVLLHEDATALRLGDASGAIREVPRKTIRATTPLTISLMPPGLLEALTPEEQRDLLSFLLTAPLEPAPVAAPNPPPPRNRAELEAVLAKAGAQNRPSASKKPLRILLVFGRKDHGSGEHDYPQWAERWAKLLPLAENVSATTQAGWPTDAQFASSDVIAFYSSNPEWSPERKPALDDYVHRGGGLVFIHWAIEGRDNAEILAESIGLASNTKTTKYRHGPLQLTFPNANHPITRGFGPVQMIDESYWALLGDPQRVNVLAEQVEEGAARPQLWTIERGAGRVFVCIPGHYTWTFDDPLFRLWLLRGICWAAKEPVDRLNDLVTIGARIEPSAK
jgi:putative heme-binding domain-containing protein